MENAEEVLQRLDEFSKHRPKTIPKELEDYLCYVARTGDPVYQWSIIKYLFKEKLLSVITDFYETSPGIDIPQCPNVDPFNYDVMKNSLVERIEGFASAPFTVQRICELLTTPRKNYNRIDKFMRAVEKNVLVVSTREPGPQRHSESESGEHIDSIVNGSENSEYNVDVEMEDISNWKENSYQNQERAPQPSSSEMAMNVDSTPSVEKTESAGTEHTESNDHAASVTPDMEISHNLQTDHPDSVSKEICESNSSQPVIDIADKDIGLSEDAEKTENNPIEQNDDSPNETNAEPPGSIEIPHIPSNEQPENVGDEICEPNEPKPIDESSTKETDPPEVQLASTEFLIDSTERKSPIEPETDPLAIEETAGRESPSDKQSAATIPEENTIILSSILYDQKEQKDSPENPEISVASSSIQDVPSEPSEDSSNSQI